MVCTYCGGNTQVANSRHQLKNNQVWRRRLCLKCKATFTTQEKIQYELAWVVSRRAGSFRPFSRDKLLLSMSKCCEHRQNALSDAQGLTETIINKLSTYITKDAPGTLLSQDIAQVAQVALNRFDRAASVHYQAHHRHGS